MYKDKKTLKSYFETGDKPTQQEYTNLIESTRSMPYTTSTGVKGFWELTDVQVKLTTPAWITAQGDNGPMFPCIFDARVLGASRLADYYIYYCTDHSSGVGGIGMAITNDLFNDPWVDQGKLFDQNLTGLTGTQVETPDVLPIFNPDGTLNRLSMTVHLINVTGANGVQTTVELFSSDGVTWTVSTANTSGIVVDLLFPQDHYRILGDGHTGYERRWVEGGIEYIYGEMGGSVSSFRMASARPYGSDGIYWPVSGYLPMQFNGYKAQARQVTAQDGTSTSNGTNSSHQGNIPSPFFFRGKRYVVTHVQDSPPTVPGAGDQTADLAIFEVNDDFQPCNPLLIITRQELPEMSFSVKYGAVHNVNDDYIAITFFGMQDASHTGQCIGIAKGALH